MTENCFNVSLLNCFKTVGEFKNFVLENSVWKEIFFLPLNDGNAALIEWPFFSFSSKMSFLFFKFPSDSFKENWKPNEMNLPRIRWTMCEQSISNCKFLQTAELIRGDGSSNEKKNKNLNIWG